MTAPVGGTSRSFPEAETERDGNTEDSLHAAGLTMVRVAHHARERLYKLKPDPFDGVRPELRVSRLHAGERAGLGGIDAPGIGRKERGRMTVAPSG